MPYYRRRRTPYRRKRYTPNRMYRRRFRRGYKYSKRGQKVYLYTRFTGVFANIVCDGINPTLLAYNFSLNDLPNYTEFTTLYDNYKLNGVKIMFRPKVTQSVSTGSINNPDATVPFYTCIDYNDSGALPTIDAIRDYKTCRVSTILRPKARYIHKPKIVDSSSSVRSAWLSTASADINWYGLKVSIPPTTTATTFGVEAKYYLSFKNVK